MYCPKCGKENPDGARFCMYCGADLSEYKVEISPKIEVSPNISVSAKAEGVPYPKWKPKVERYAEIKGVGKLPVYKRFAEYEGKFFCPQCENYDSIDKIRSVQIKNVNQKEVTIDSYGLFKCIACGKRALIFQDSEQYQLP